MSSVRAQRNNNIQPVPSTDRPTMSKGTRFVTFAVPAVIAYFLLLLHVLPTPFLAQETADQILPVVSYWLPSAATELLLCAEHYEEGTGINEE